MTTNNHPLEHTSRESAESTLALLSECGLTALCIRQYVLGKVVATGDESHDSDMQVDFSRPQGVTYKILGREWTGPNRESIDGACHYAIACEVSGLLHMAWAKPQDVVDEIARQAIAERLPLDASVYGSLNADAARGAYRRSRLAVTR